MRPTGRIDGTRSWEYDAIGNVTRLSVDSGLPGEGQVDYAYQVNPSGKNTPELSTLSATSGGSPLWTSTLNTDPAGNITTDGASTYDYDLRNLLGDRQLGGVTSQHTFDAAGRRVETTRSDTGTTTELILGPAGQRLAKQENSVWRDYVWLGDRLIAYFDQGDTDPTLVFTNHIGMPLLATDGAGAPVWEAKAEPYGQLRGTVDKIHDPALRYPGQWQDELELEATCTGDDCTLPGPLEQSFSLSENGYRWYRPDWGRYTQADPLGVRGDPNIFLYGQASPLRLIDRLGLASCKPWEPVGQKITIPEEVLTQEIWGVPPWAVPLDVLKPALPGGTPCCPRRFYDVFDVTLQFFMRTCPCACGNSSQSGDPKIRIRESSEYGTPCRFIMQYGEEEFGRKKIRSFSRWEEEGCYWTYPGIGCQRPSGA